MWLHSTVYGPWMYPIYFTRGMYYSWDPGYVAFGATENWAGCASGTCGGGIGAGACGGAGGCGNITNSDEGPYGSGVSNCGGAGVF